MNMNDLAKLVCKHEGGKVEVSIAQMKEIIRVIALIFRRHPKLFMAFIRYGIRIEKNLARKKKELGPIGMETHVVQKKDLLIKS